MNEHFDLTEILKDCPKGTKLYSPILGDCKFEEVCIDCVKVRVGHFVFSINQNATFPLGTINSEEPMLFPSREQRDWNKWVCPKKTRFDPKILKAFDKVLVRDSCTDKWTCNFISFITDREYPIVGINTSYRMGIPYNEETKHLLGTNEEAPEFFRYWED